MIVLMDPPGAMLLSHVVRERARLLAPAILVALTFFVAGAGPLGLPTVWPVYGMCWLAVFALVGLTVALWWQLVPLRFIHLASAMVLWCPLVAASLTFWQTPQPVLLSLLVTMIVSTGVLLHTAWVATTLIATTGALIFLVHRAQLGHLTVWIASLVTAAVFALLVHILMRRALVRAETHRLAEAATSEQLARQLAELEASQRARAQLQDQLLHAQRMEAVGTLAAGVAHDMNNVLASIMGFGSLLLEDEERASARADLQQILTQAERGAGLTRGLLAFSRRGQYRKQIVQIDEVVRGVLPLLARTLPKRIEVVAELGCEHACVDADPVHVHQALVNFGLNAAEAMADGGTVTISTELVELDGEALPQLPAGRYVRLAVTDTGRGMDAATRLRVFEPFFTTKAIGQGTGLGLALVWGIVQAHGGAVDVESEPGRGTTFRVHLPLTDAAATPARRSKSQPIARAATVLVIDDEPRIRQSTKRLLERMGLSVLTAVDGQDGLRVFAAHADEIELVLLDMAMPVMGGAECFARLREQSQVPVLVVTGYAVDAEVQALVAAGAAVLEKPYTIAGLERNVATMLQLEVTGQGDATGTSPRACAKLDA